MGLTANELSPFKGTGGSNPLASAGKHAVQRHNLTPKSDAGRRTINIPPTVLDKLDYSREWLFVNRDGVFVKSRGFHERVWTPAVVRADLKLDTPPQIRDLRHTCASWMLRAGVPMDVVKDHMGHESIEVTNSIYRHISRAEHRAASAAIAEALGQASPKL